jgi:hypothetical protein
MKGAKFCLILKDRQRAVQSGEFRRMVRLTGDPGAPLTSPATCHSIKVDLRNVITQITSKNDHQRRHLVIDSGAVYGQKFVPDLYVPTQGSSFLSPNKTSKINIILNHSRIYQAQ